MHFCKKYKDLALEKKTTYSPLKNLYSVGVRSLWTYYFSNYKFIKKQRFFAVFCI